MTGKSSESVSVSQVQGEIERLLVETVREKLSDNLEVELKITVSLTTREKSVEVRKEE